MKNHATTEKNEGGCTYTDMKKCPWYFTKRGRGVGRYKMVCTK